MKRNRSDGVRLRKVVNPANLLSLLRVVLVPVAIRSYLVGDAVAYLLAVAAICASDVVDGVVARATGTAGPLGAAVDVAADAIAVFGLQAMLVAKGQWPISLVVASAVSLAAFVASSRSRRQVVRLPFGRYFGTTVMGLLFVHAVIAMARPAWWDVVTRLLTVPTCIYAIGALVENVVRIPRAPIRRTSPRRNGRARGVWVHAAGMSEVHKQ